MYKILRNQLKDRFSGHVQSVALLQLARVMCTAMVILIVSGLFNIATADTTFIHTANAIKTAPADRLTTITDPFNMDITDGGTAEKHVTCYPNPAISYINFKFDKSVPKDTRLFVFSFTGRKMTELAITGTVHKISLENYYRGLYVYQLRSANGAILESGKFQVKN